MLIAVGAILKYAVNETTDVIDIQVVGTILLVIGILGLIISLVYMFMSGRRSEPYEQPVARDRYRDRY